MRGLRIAALLVVAVAMVGCATRGAPARQPAPTSVITPSPTPTPVVQPSEAALVAACDGKAVPDAAEVGGVLHPTVVVEAGKIAATYKINGPSSQWTTPIQLVICLGAHKTVQVKDCGNVTRTWTTGLDIKFTQSARGRLYILQDQMAVKVVAARTSKTVSSTTLGGELLSCAQVTTDYGDPERLAQGQTTTWRISGKQVDAAKVDEFANALVIKELATPKPSAVKS